MGALRAISTAAVVLIGLATLLGLLDRVSWIFEGAGVFPWVQILDRVIDAAR